MIFVWLDNAVNCYNNFFFNNNFSYIFSVIQWSQEMWGLSLYQFLKCLVSTRFSLLDSRIYLNNHCGTYWILRLFDGALIKTDWKKRFWIKYDYFLFPIMKTTRIRQNETHAKVFPVLMPLSSPWSGSSACIGGLASSISLRISAAFFIYFDCWFELYLKTESLRLQMLFQRAVQHKYKKIE